MIDRLLCAVVNQAAKMVVAVIFGLICNIYNTSVPFLLNVSCKKIHS